MQYEMPMLQSFESVALTELPEHLVALCSRQHEAVSLCVANSRIKRSHADWGYLIGKTRGEFTALLNGGSSDRRRTFNDEQILSIQREAGNMAVSQWWMLAAKGQLINQRAAAFINSQVAV